MTTSLAHSHGQNIQQFLESQLETRPSQSQSHNTWLVFIAGRQVFSTSSFATLADIICQVRSGEAVTSARAMDKVAMKHL